MAVEAMVSAQIGKPLGVATIEVPLASAAPVGSAPRLRVTDAGGRVLYPVSGEVTAPIVRPSERPVPEPGRGRLLGRLGSLIRELTNEDRATEQTIARRVSFLFPNDEPIIVSVYDENGEIGQYELVPESNPPIYATLLRGWWSDYTTGVKTQIDSGDYPPWVETYLVAMLSGRMRLPLPDWFQTRPNDEDELLSTLKLIGGAEDESEVIFRRAATGGMTNASANGQGIPETVTVPPGPRWAPSFADVNPNVVGLDTRMPTANVEPIAESVPPECFYLRYGSFENYLWFTDLSNDYGGEISRMISLRGFRGQSTQTIQSQLNLQMTQMSRMLGPSIIQDQAIIGRDLFLSDGASIGVLFKVNNAFLFRRSLQNDRTATASSDDAVELSDTTINGQTVSFLRTADNRIRSFMVEKGDSFLVTNSETIASRFLEVADSGQSLAKTPEFQLARRLMPIERNDSVFVYLSPLMLKGLVSPDYMIELRRRLDSKSDITLVQLARLASAAEGFPTGSIDELIRTGYLPANFNERMDGSGVVSVGEDLIDTRRGARGTFLPIADTPLKQVSVEEAAWYAQIAEAYSSRFARIDPIMAGIHRKPVLDADGNPTSVEQLSIHAEVAPWSPDQYGKWAKQLGPPTRVAMRFAPDDIVAVQAHVASDYLGPPTHLFAAIKDSVPPNPDDFDGLLNSYRALRQLPGYLGAWPLPGVLDRLPLGLGRGTPVAPGMTKLIGGLYRYTGGGFSVLSFYPDILTASLPFLTSVEVNDMAQLRARVGNLRGSRLETWVTQQLFKRSATTSHAGATFLDMMSRQLKVDPANALADANRIFAAGLQCTLGGEYHFDSAANRWLSTAWQNHRTPFDPPQSYTPPLLQWFRGGQATLTQYEDRVVVDAMIDMAR
ncbi:hypothetical protein [Novipirellula aureliae]|nr:hypothetical protein [Novipirellula aureliae]